MREFDSGTFSAVVAVIGLVFCIGGALLLGRTGVLGLVAWALVLFGFAALVQAVLARLGLYVPGGAGDRDEDGSGSP
jgi:hypothetical protein